MQKLITKVIIFLAVMMTELRSKISKSLKRNIAVSIGTSREPTAVREPFWTNSAARRIEKYLV